MFVGGRSFSAVLALHFWTEEKVNYSHALWAYGGLPIWQEGLWSVVLAWCWGYCTWTSSWTLSSCVNLSLILPLPPLLLGILYREDLLVGQQTSCLCYTWAHIMLQSECEVFMSYRLGVWYCWKCSSLKFSWLYLYRLTLRDINAPIFLKCGIVCQIVTMKTKKVALL